jgi:hypothetical protein
MVISATVDAADPTRAKLRSEMEEPKLIKLNTEMPFMPARTQSRRDTVEPSAANLSTDGADLARIAARRLTDEAA